MFSGSIIRVASLSANLSSYSGETSSAYRLINTTIVCSNVVDAECVAQQGGVSLLLRSLPG